MRHGFTSAATAPFVSSHWTAESIIATATALRKAPGQKVCLCWVAGFHRHFMWKELHWGALLSCFCATFPTSPCVKVLLCLRVNSHTRFADDPLQPGSSLQAEIAAASLTPDQQPFGWGRMLRDALACESFSFISCIFTHTHTHTHTYMYTCAHRHTAWEGQVSDALWQQIHLSCDWCQNKPDLWISA